MKQGELAVLLDLSGQQECSRLENGYKNFSAELITKLVVIFSISKEEFLSSGKPDTKKEINSSKKLNINRLKKEKKKGGISKLLHDIKKVQNEYSLLQKEMKLPILKRRMAC